jgi:hypothetical protein
MDLHDGRDGSFELANFKQFEGRDMQDGLAGIADRARELGDLRDDDVELELIGDHLDNAEGNSIFPERETGQELLILARDKETGDALDAFNVANLIAVIRDAVSCERTEDKQLCEAAEAIALICSKCGADMHEPDNQSVSAEISDFGDSIILTNDAGVSERVTMHAEIKANELIRLAKLCYFY